MTTKEKQINLTQAIVAVVATMMDCEREGIPCVASMIYLAMEARGLSGLNILAVMSAAGIIQPAAEVLTPGPKFKEIADALVADGFVKEGKVE